MRSPSRPWTYGPAASVPRRSDVNGLPHRGTGARRGRQAISDLPGVARWICRPQADDRMGPAVLLVVRGCASPRRRCVLGDSNPARRVSAIAGPRSINRRSNRVDDPGATVGRCSRLNACVRSPVGKRTTTRSSRARPRSACLRSPATRRDLSCRAGASSRTTPRPRPSGGCAPGCCARPTAPTRRGPHGGCCATTRLPPVCLPCSRSRTTIRSPCSTGPPRSPAPSPSDPTSTPSGSGRATGSRASGRRICSSRPAPWVPTRRSSPRARQVSSTRSGARAGSCGSWRPTGRILPGRLFDALDAAVGADLSVDRIPLSEVERIAGPTGLDAPARVARRVDCPVAPELLRPVG